jgi:hypothetical protein
MRQAWRFVRRWWWAFVGGVAAVFASILAALLTSRSCGDEQRLPGEAPERKWGDRARQEVERARFEGEIERARVKATAEAQKKQLEGIEIVAQTDPAEARRWLAVWLKDNL